MVQLMHVRTVPEKVRYEFNAHAVQFIDKLKQLTQGAEQGAAIGTPVS